MNSYIDKNRGFVTSSKLKLFELCPLCYKCKYIDEMPDPTDGDFDKDYFIIGQALDDRLTNGEDYFAQNYEVVARRTKESNKIQLTNTMFKTIDQLSEEYRAQSMFNQDPTKKVLSWEFSGLKLRGELDDFDEPKGLIRDIKTCANLLTFDPDNYLMQMSFYQWGVEELTGLKCDAQLMVVDKYKDFSRSQLYHFSKYTLESYRGRMMQLLEDLKEAEEFDLWIPQNDFRKSLICPYYAHHHRSHKPITL